ncbi:MAG: phosphoethanolamine transferase [Proteobacteria bacterium]|nr:MAG: phosphoethanolamine transferase [Pseudomonadota bacterium]
MSYLRKRLAAERPSLGAVTLLLATVLYIVLTGNQRLWHQVADLVGWSTPAGIATFASFFLFLVSLFTLILAPATHRRVFKPLAITLLLIVATVSWFQDTYGTIVDRDMIRSALTTDALEARELLTAGFAAHMILFWLLPSAAIVWIRIEHPSGLRLAMRTAVIMLVSAIALVATVWSGYRNFSVLARDHGELKMLVNPTYAIYSAIDVMSAGAPSGPSELIPVGEDATRTATPASKPRVVVLVLGETARADHFQLNGYTRSTNPKLEVERVLNFPDVSSCGTSTAVSVPCIFSSFGRDAFDTDDSRRHENLLHVLDRTGVDVLWRDNNTGCKGVCAGFEYESFRKANDTRFCDADGCIDEIMLEGLERRILASDRDLFIVLHQAGSHGPAYYRRYPESFSVYTPECRSDSPEACSTQELINSYDNSIRYTDYFLSRVIDLLRDLSPRRDAAMLYVSDHGESLGENGLFLHGLPYAIAPRVQTHVPMVLWLDESFHAGSVGARACLQQRASTSLSHDNVFHTLLGLFDVQSRDHTLALDVVAPCVESLIAESERFLQDPLTPDPAAGAVH